MIKYAIATHGKMAEGLESTIKLFLPEKRISYFSAYVTTTNNIEKELFEFVVDCEEDAGIIFTDILGGSVNQKALIASVEKENIFVISGFNLSLVIDLLTKEVIDSRIIEESIEQSRLSMVLSNFDTIKKENDIDFFE